MIWSSTIRLALMSNGIHECCLDSPNRLFFIPLELQHVECRCCTSLAVDIPFCEQVDQRQKTDNNTSFEVKFKEEEN